MAFAAFAVGFIVFGVIYSFGLFLEPMMADLGASRSATSTLYAISSGAFYFLGPATGSIGDRFGPRAVASIGALLMAVGLTATAFVPDVRLAYLTYGIGVGVGAACAYIPTFAVLGGWFDRWRTRAMGIAATGTGLGMLALPPLSAVIIERSGWRTACLILAAISGTVLAVSASLVRPAPDAVNPEPREPLGTALRSAAFMHLYLSWVLGTIGLFVPLIFLPAFAIARGADPIAAAWLISIVGGASIVGRLGIGMVVSATGALFIYKLSVLAMAVSYVLWLLLPGYAGLMFFAAVLGVAYGVRISLVAPVLVGLFGSRRLGGLLGTFFTATGIASVVTPAATGIVIGHWGSDIAGAGLALVFGILAFILILPLREAPISPETGVSQS